MFYVLYFMFFILPATFGIKPSILKYTTFDHTFSLTPVNCAVPIFVDLLAYSYSKEFNATEPVQKIIQIVLRQLN